MIDFIRGEATRVLGMCLGDVWLRGCLKPVVGWKRFGLLSDCLDGILDWLFKNRVGCNVKYRFLYKL
jgi:hypothetical protein